MTGVPSGSSLLIQWLSYFLTVTHQKSIYDIVIQCTFMYCLEKQIHETVFVFTLHDAFLTLAYFTEKENVLAATLKTGLMTHC